MQRILVAVDFSEPSRLALRHADALAKHSGATLTLVHVHSVVDMQVLDYTAIESPEQMNRETTLAEATLRDWVHDLATPSAKVHTMVVTGPPVGELLRLSQSYDLLVLGTHGRKGLSRFLLGSVAERVARGAHCSVLIAKEGQRLD